MSLYKILIFEACRTRDAGSVPPLWALYHETNAGEDAGAFPILSNASQDEGARVSRFEAPQRDLEITRRDIHSQVPPFPWLRRRVRESERHSQRSHRRARPSCPAPCRARSCAPCYPGASHPAKVQPQSSGITDLRVCIHCYEHLRHHISDAQRMQRSAYFTASSQHGMCLHTTAASWKGLETH